MNALVLSFSCLFLIWSIYLFILKPYLKTKEFRAWRNQPHIKRTLQALKQLYQPVNTLEIARSAWDKRQMPDYAFIYGEIDIISFIAILEVVQPKSGEIFYDLGSGAGKAVFTAALAFEFAQCKGIELVPELYNLSCQLLKALSCQRRPCRPRIASSDITNRIQFIQADFLHYDFNDANVIFINAACFLGEAWQAVVAKLKQLKSGARIIVGAKELPSTHFTLLNSELRYMSWGPAKVSVYLKLP